MLQDMGVYIDEPWSMNPSWKLIVAGQSVSKFDVCQYVKKKDNFWDLKQTTSGNVENTFLTFLTFFNLSQERYATFFTCMILLLLTS